MNFMNRIEESIREDIREIMTSLVARGYDPLDLALMSPLTLMSLHARELRLDEQLLPKVANG